MLYTQKLIYRNKCINIKGEEKSAIRYVQGYGKSDTEAREKEKTPAPILVPSFKYKFKRGPFIVIFRYSEW